MCPVSRHSPTSDTLEHPLDLPRRLDVGPGLRVEGRARSRGRGSGPPPGPARRRTAAIRRRRAERGLPERTGRAAAPLPAAAVGQRGPRRRPGQVGPHRVERVQHGVQLAGSACSSAPGSAYGSSTYAPARPEAALGQQLAEPLAVAEVSDRAEVDAGVACRGHLVEDARPARHVRVLADGQLERAVADRGVRHRYRRPGVAGLPAAHARGPVLAGPGRVIDRRAAAGGSR